MSSSGRGLYLGVDAMLDDDYEYCHWCEKLLADGGYGIEGHDFCDEFCASSWWEEWCRE